jgi:hypothetical protein
MAGLSAFYTLLTKIQQWNDAGKKFHNNEATPTFALESEGSSYQSLYDLHKRDELLASAQEVSSRDAKRGELSGVMCAMDFMAGAERDFRMRHKSRLDNYRHAALQKLGTSKTIDLLKHKVQKMEQEGAK